MVKRVLLVGLIIIVVIMAALEYRSLHETFIVVDFLTYFIRSIRSEVFAVLIAVLLILILDDWRTTQREKQMLITQLGSPDSSIAAEAARILRVRGWLTDGSLHGLFLVQANLQGAKLWRADLHDAEMMESNLSEANLHKINLANAKLWESNLQGAEMMDAKLYKTNFRKANLREVKLWQADLRNVLLEQADLQGANLRNANLRNALLQRANVQGVNFSKANLQGADFAHARFDETTILPDGLYWSKETDLTRFTNPQHINFWRPDVEDSDSPVWYRLDEQEEDERE